jgi:LmbE family N-acetylglucosaminyl deacetylase
MYKTVQDVIQQRKVRRIAVLSPHPDDIALSIGGTVCQFPEDVEVTFVTVFTHTVFAPGNPKSMSAEEVSRIRCQEEQQFADSVHADLHSLHFSDTSILQYSEKEMQGDYQADPRTKAVFERIDHTLQSLSPDLIFAPLGLGEHIDHRIVFEAVKQSPYAQEHAFLLYYEDVPYVWYVGAENVPALVNSRIGEQALPILVDITTDKEKKHEALLIYQSQINPDSLEQDEKSIFDYATQIHGQDSCYAERLWLVKQ